MRTLLKPLFIGFVSLATLVSFSSSAIAADTTAPSPAPAGIPADTWNAFYATSFVIEGANANTRRWTQPPRISLLGSPNDSDIATARNLINKLGKLCPSYSPTLDVSNSLFNANIYYVPQSEYSKYIPTANSTSDSSLHYFYYTGSGLSKVTSVINSGISSQFSRDYWTTVRIIQNLGMLTFSTNSAFALFSASTSDVEAITEKDKELLALFCSSALFPGDSFQTSTKSVQAMLGKRASQVPNLLANIDVAPFTNSASVKISLTNLSDLLASGTFTMNYEVVDKAGSRVASGSEDNSQNRLQNEWKFDISGLESSNKYKINLSFSNSAGAGKTLSQSFTTLEGFVETPSEQVEQIISLFDLPASFKLSEKSMNLVLSTSSGLDPTVESLSPRICTVDGLELKFLKSGICSFKISQEGDTDFLPADDVFASFLIQGTATSITCVKGKVIKKVTGTNPICPTGYKKK
jgi:hypothetical protein